jgi:hypothetical protein
MTSGFHVASRQQMKDELNLAISVCWYNTFVRQRNPRPIAIQTLTRLQLGRRTSNAIIIIDRNMRALGTAMVDGIYQLSTVTMDYLLPCIENIAVIQKV